VMPLSPHRMERVAYHPCGLPEGKRAWPQASPSSFTAQAETVWDAGGG